MLYVFIPYWYFVFYAFMVYNIVSKQEGISLLEKVIIMSGMKEQDAVMRVGEKIRSLRGKLSREDFVATLDNVITAHLYRIETGMRKASDKVLLKISEKYEKPLSWFYAPIGTDTTYAGANVHT